MITLGIIGVVAAITLPTLIQNYRRHVVANKLKTDISILQQALQRSIADNGSPDNWDIDNQDVFDVYIKPYIKILNEGIMKYDMYFQNSSAHYFIPNFKTYKLSNGTILIFRKDKTLYRRGSFYILLKEKKDGKYIFGKDIFTFNLILGTDDSGRFYITSSSDFHPVYSSFCAKTPEYLKELCTTGNNPSGFAMGVGCSALIECNSWEFPKDYPIKL